MKKTHRGACKPRGDWNGIKPYTRIIPDKRQKMARKADFSELRKGGDAE